jgi:hypothetical protein
MTISPPHLASLHLYHNNPLQELFTVSMANHPENLPFSARESTCFESTRDRTVMGIAAESGEAWLSSLSVKEYG